MASTSEQRAPPGRGELGFTPQDESRRAGWHWLTFYLTFSSLGFVYQAFFGELFLQSTIRLSLAFFGWAWLLMLGLSGSDWHERAGKVVRLAWTLAWLLYLAHVAAAFHEAHHWSHVEAVRHVEKQSGFGPGIYFSHLFTLVWSLDVAWWWLAPLSYARRPTWIVWAIHGYLAFITFNATVVYGGWSMRFSGALLFILLGVTYWLTRRKTYFGEGL